MTRSGFALPTVGGDHWRYRGRRRGWRGRRWGRGGYGYGFGRGRRDDFSEDFYDGDGPWDY